MGHKDSGRNKGASEISDRKPPGSGVDVKALYQLMMEGVGALVRAIAHDFNNHLASILPNAQMIMMKSSPDDPAYRRATSIEKAAIKAAELVKDLRSLYPKVKADAPVNLNATIEKAIDVAAQLLRKDVNVEKSLQEDLWPIEGKEDQLVLAIANLTVVAAEVGPEASSPILKTENVLLDDELARLQLQPGRYVRVNIASGQSAPAAPDQSPPRLNSLIDIRCPPQHVMAISLAFSIVRGHNGRIGARAEEGVAGAFDLYFPAA